MRRPGGLFWMAMAFVAGIGNYTVKQFVQGLDDELTGVHRQTIAEQKQIHDLTAEWTYLNQPELLADLNRRYLGLVAVSPKQERTGIADLPMRPAPPPEPAPQPQLVADATAPQPAATAPAIAPVPAPLPAPAPASAKPPAAIVLADNTPAAAPKPAAAPRPTAAERPKPASLDALFAQVAGDR